MSKPDKTKKQRMTDFNFSHPDAHVAIVDKAANGKSKFLVVKNLGKENVDEKYMSNELVTKSMELRVSCNEDSISNLIEENKRIKTAMQNVVEVPLVDLLQKLGLWSETAIWVANLTTKAENNVIKSSDLFEVVKSEVFNVLEGSLAASKQVEVVKEASVSKSENGENMTDKVDDAAKPKDKVEKVEVTSEEVLKQLDALKSKVAVYEGIEQARINKSFEDKAEKYVDLGLSKEQAPLLRAISEVEGSEVIFKALDKAMEFVSKKVETEEKGTGKQEEVTKTESGVNKNYDKIKQVAMKYLQDNPTCGLTLQQAVVKAVSDNPALLA